MVDIRKMKTQTAVSYCQALARAVVHNPNKTGRHQVLARMWRHRNPVLQGWGSEMMQVILKTAQGLPENLESPHTAEALPLDTHPQRTEGRRYRGIVHLGSQQQ